MGRDGGLSRNRCGKGPLRSPGEPHDRPGQRTRGRPAAVGGAQSRLLLLLLLQEQLKPKQLAFSPQWRNPGVLSGHVLLALP